MSIDTNLLDIYEDITKLIDKRIPVDFLPLDQTKAFEKVPYHRLKLNLEYQQLIKEVVV